jgi:hypothetical protein
MPILIRRGKVRGRLTATTPRPCGGAVVESLGIDRLRIGAYQGPGVARATTEQDEVVALSLKSGKLGPADMFLPTLESMRHSEP